MPMIALLLLAQAAASVPLTPSGPWQLERGALRCALSRAFADGARTRTFALVSEVPFGTTEVQVIDPAVGPGDKQSFDVRVAIDGQTPVENVKAESVVDRQLGARITRLLLVNALRQPIANARRIAVISPEFALDITPGGMAKAYATFDTCVRDLATRLGVDVTLLDAVDQPPELIIDKSRRIDDFTHDLLKRSKIGFVRMLLTTDERGRVSRCNAIEISGPNGVGAQACRSVTRQLKFKPAAGKTGDPVSAQLLYVFAWERKY